jgi:hypothetical protein
VFKFNQNKYVILDFDAESPQYPPFEEAFKTSIKYAAPSAPGNIFL